MDNAPGNAAWALDPVQVVRGALLYGTLTNVVGAVVHLAGFGDPSVEGEAAILAPDSDTFSSLTLQDTFLLRHCSQRAFVAHGEVVLCVGCLGRGQPSITIIDPRSGSVEAVAPGFDFWYCATAGVLRGADGTPFLVAFGGRDSQDTVGDTWVVDLTETSSGWTWRHLGDNGPAPRLYHLGAVVRQRFLYIFGGAPATTDTQPGDPVFDDLWRFDVHTTQWARLDPEGPCPPKRGSAAFHFHDPYLYLYGGYDGAAVPDFWRYDVDVNLWEALPIPPAIRATAGVWACGSATRGDELLIVGGVPADTCTEGGPQPTQHSAAVTLHDRRLSLRSVIRRYCARHHNAFGFSTPSEAMRHTAPL